MADNFVLEGLDYQIELYEIERGRYLKKFKECKKKYSMIKILSNIPGIGEIGAMKLVSRVVDAHRFETRNHFLSYCGLIKLEKISGGRSYGRKNPRFSRMMKSVFKTAILAVIGGNNEFADYYKYCLNEKKYSERVARSALGRRIATTTYGVMKSGKKYDSLKNIKSRRKKDVNNL